MEKVLISGGAGYIGSVLIRLLLEKGYSVRVIDNLMYGGDSISDLLLNTKFDFINGDIRTEKDCQRAIEGIDFVVHLAAIVGDPACLNQPQIAKSINLAGSINLYRQANEMGVKRFVFSSTCSNYGKMKDPDLLLNEESSLAPISLYAETKVMTEQFLLSQPISSKCIPICLRFATAYGISYRPRFDLTVNEFTKDAALGRDLTVYGDKFWRPYCHVADLARAILVVLEADENLVRNEVYNVGDSSENYQKGMIINEIREYFPDLQVKLIDKKEDPRDYRVSFSKIANKLDYKITRNVSEGIGEIIEFISNESLIDPDDYKYRNS